MVNRITQDTWDLWWRNIMYLNDNADDPETAANDILNYLEGEGAFTLIKEDSE